MAEIEAYDAIIIGSGQAGGPLATALVKAGKKTALIEREHIGGTCVNVGCTPTKTMIASARVAYMAERAGDFGIRVPGTVTVDMKAVRERKRRMVESFRAGSLEAITRGGVAVVMGEARFLSSTEVLVEVNAGGQMRLTSPLIVIDTGARPSVPAIPGLSEVPTLNSTTVMDLDRVPRHLVILGGGYVGVEFAQMFRRFGSEVTIVEAAPALLAHEDDDVAAAVAGILREDGIAVMLDAEVTRVSQPPGGDIVMAVKRNQETRSLAGSHLLVAAGRTPNAEDLNLSAAGVELDEKGFVKVDERLRTSREGIYATGDVVGGPAFTHISYDDFRILKTNLLDGGHRTTRDRLVPYTVFMDPQLGRVGLTEREARAQGRDFKVATIPMSQVARAVEVSETRGFMKAIVDADTEQVLGCAILAIEGGEMMAMLEIAMMARLSYTALRDGIFAHPTLAESFNTLFQSFGHP